MTFDSLNLNKPLLNALTDLGLTEATTIQEKVFSHVMSGRDVVATAQTGTGKTFAYLLPCLRLYQYNKEKNPQILILVPTRELVVQVVDAIEKLSTYISIDVLGIYGGVNMKTQIAAINEGVDVLVATPGRLIDLFANSSLKAKSIKRLIIDEFDEMLNLGFRSQLQNIHDRLPVKRQNLLFSATISPEVEEIIDIFTVNPIRIEAEAMGTPLQNIAQSYYEVPNFYTKINLVEHLLAQDNTMEKVLVFVSTKKTADLLFQQLSTIYGDKVEAIHSNKAQNARFRSVENFESGACRILMASDIFARGIDVSTVTHVINFDLPDVPENYIHRIGRTGRVEKKGVAISFVSPQEKEQFEAIEAFMNYEVPKQKMPKDVEISDRLLEAERPKIIMKAPPIKTPNVEKGLAFHEKIAKNSKTNVKRDYEAEKRRKYGKSYEKRKKE